MKKSIRHLKNVKWLNWAMTKRIGIKIDGFDLKIWILGDIIIHHALSRMIKMIMFMYLEEIIGTFILNINIIYIV